MHKPDKIFPPIFRFFYFSSNLCHRVPTAIINVCYWIVNAIKQSLFPTFFTQFLQNISLERYAVYIKDRIFARPNAKPVMVFWNDYHIFASGLNSYIYNLFRIEILRIPFHGNRVRHTFRSTITNSPGISCTGWMTSHPMDEQTQFGILKLF